MQSFGIARISAEAFNTTAVAFSALTRSNVSTAESSPLQLVKWDRSEEKRSVRKERKRIKRSYKPSTRA